MAQKSGTFHYFHGHFPYHFYQRLISQKTTFFFFICPPRIDSFTGDKTWDSGHVLDVTLYNAVLSACVSDDEPCRVVCGLAGVF